MKYIEEELTLAEFSERFLGNSDFKTENVYDLVSDDIEVLTLDSNGNKVYKSILSFLVKNGVSKYYTDGILKCTENHRIIENGVDIFAKNHKDFKQINEPMDVVDIEVADAHSYLANGRLNHNTTSGGKALAFHSSVRLRLKGMGQIKQKVNGNDKVVGMKVRCQVIKNRMGPPLRSADFEIYFDRGIDNYGSWLGVMKENKLVKLAGAWYTYIDTDTGEEIKFQSKDFIDMMEDRDELREQIYQRICESTILQYKSNSKDIDTMELDDSEAEVKDE